MSDSYNMTPAILTRGFAQLAKFSLGEHIEHSHFGTGQVTARGTANPRIQVSFETEGSKWLLLPYAKIRHKNACLCCEQKVPAKAALSLAASCLTKAAIDNSKSDPSGPQKIPTTTETKPARADKGINRRRILQGLLASGLSAKALACPLPKKALKIQNSPIKGWQYHAGNRCITQLQEGAKLQLQCEPDNLHDKNAVAVYWQQYKLGYVPRYENTAVSQMLNRGETLQATVSQIKQPEFWQPVVMDIWWEG